MMNGFPVYWNNLICIIVARIFVYLGFTLSKQFKEKLKTNLKSQHLNISHDVRLYTFSSSTRILVIFFCSIWRGVSSLSSLLELVSAELRTASSLIFLVALFLGFYPLAAYSKLQKNLVPKQIAARLYYIQGNYGQSQAILSGGHVEHST